MKKFAFSLDFLHRYRKSVEEKEQQALHRIQLSIERERAHLEQLQSQERETLIGLELERRHAVDPREWRWYELYLDHLRQQILQSSRQIAALEAEYSRQREVLVQASKNRQVLDRLAEKKKREYLKAEKQIEQKDVDEIVVLDFARESKTNRP